MQHLTMVYDDMLANQKAMLTSVVLPACLSMVKVQDYILSNPLSETLFYVLCNMQNIHSQLGGKQVKIKCMFFCQFYSVMRHTLCAVQQNSILLAIYKVKSSYYSNCQIQCSLFCYSNCQITFHATPPLMFSLQGVIEHISLFFCTELSLKW